MKDLPGEPRKVVRLRYATATILGLTQILGYGSTFYLLAVLALPISKETGWSFDWIAAGLSIGLFLGGLSAPLIGRAIDRYGGRPVLTFGSLCIAVGLAGIGMSTHVLMYWLAWGIVGFGMAASLYEAAFSALGHWYRDEARAPITVVTLWGGFASTVCWPLSAYLVAMAGWRETCLIYAVANLLLAVPLHSLLMPRASDGKPISTHIVEGKRAPEPARRLLIALVGVSVTLSAVIVTVIAVQLIPVLQELGVSASSAVWIGALIGPSQVAGRVAELALGQRVHPIWSTLAAGLLMAAGLLILNVGVHLAAVAVTVYALGAGVSYVVRGTLPLVMFGPDGYATLMGRLAFPSLVAQAMTPWASAVIVAHWDSRALLIALLMLTVANVAAIAAVALLHHR